jgi:hypothetical protein
MNPDQVAELKNNELLRKRLAKWMAQFCFRDTKLEQLHDRISDEEMRSLMMDCADHCYAFLCILFGTQGGGELIDMLKQHDQVPQWNDPEMPSELIEASKHLPSILEHVNRTS